MPLKNNPLKNLRVPSFTIPIFFRQHLRLKNPQLCVTGHMTTSVNNAFVSG